MLYPYELGQSTTARPALLLVTSPPATRRRKVAATATRARIAVQSGGVPDRRARRVPHHAPAAASADEKTIEPGNHSAAWGTRALGRSAVERKLPSTRRFNKPVSAPA